MTNHSSPLLTIGNGIIALILVVGIGSASIAYTLEQRKHSQVLDSVQQIDARANVQLPIATELMPDGTTRYTRCDGNGWCISSAHPVDMASAPSTSAQGPGVDGRPHGFHTANPEAWQPQ